MKSRRVDQGTPQTLEQPRLMRGSPPRYKTFVTLDECITAVQGLLEKHELVVGEGAVKTIAKTIQQCHTRMPREKVQIAATQKRIREARGYAKMLLRSARRPSHDDAIPAWSEELRTKLDDFSAVMWLALGQPPIDVPELLSRLKAGETLDETTLTKLVQALKEKKGGKRTGRPTVEYTRVVRDACYAWRLAGRTDAAYTWNDPDQFLDGVLTRKDIDGLLTGRLPQLIRGILSLCTSKQLGTLPEKKCEPSSINEAQASINEARAAITKEWEHALKVSDAVLHAALKAALKYVDDKLSRSGGGSCKND